MKHKKKVTFVDVSTPPPEKYHSILRGKKTDHDTVLLLLVKGIPHPMLGVYRVVMKKTDDGWKKLRAYFHVKYCDAMDDEVVGWRPCPRIPEEYWKVTGYDKYVEAD